MSTSTTFQHLTVIELASVLAGPAVGLFFAELGATVIKIENKKTGGDVTRKWKLSSEDKDKADSAYYHSVNYAKQVQFRDLQDAMDRQAVLNLIKEADIVVANFKHGAAEKLGMAYEQLKIINPRLIYAAINAYGKENPKLGFDVVIQAETGWVYMNGAPDGLPMKMPVALMDVLAAHQLKEGILIALLNRYQTGKGCQVSISLFDTGVASLANQASNWLNEGYVPQPKGSQHANIAPYGDIFETADGQLIIVAPGVEKQYWKLLDCLDLGYLKNDERFVTNALRLKNRAALNDYLSTAFRRYESAEILTNCAEQQVPIAPIRDLQQVFALPAAQRLVLSQTEADGTISKRVKTVVFEIEN
ncbi:MAG: CoA transferase [Bacteroidota bacterium]